MTMNEHESTINETRVSRSRASRILRWTLLVGFAGFMVALIVAVFTDGGLRRFFFAYLTNFAYFLSIAIGALFFVMLQHLSRAGWSVGLRRVAELGAAAFPVLVAAFAPLAILVLIGNGDLYPWAASHGEAVIVSPGGQSAAEAVSGESGHHGEAAEKLAHKAPYLNPSFFLVRWILYFGIWGVLGIWLWRESVRQDDDGDPERTRRMQRISAAGMWLYALSVSFAAVDLLMSLSPLWYSTIFGVYYFAGAMVAAFSLLIVALAALQRRGHLRQCVNVEHYHDLGKFLFGFVFFWGYIAFSQYMLIWYANMPETTFWLKQRGMSTAEGDFSGWSVVAIALLLGHLLLPFTLLLSRRVKRSRPALVACAIWLLVFHWIDLWWLVQPELSAGPLLGLPEISTFIGLGALSFAGVIRMASLGRLVPVRDPRLGESLAFKNA